MKVHFQPNRSRNQVRQTEMLPVWKFLFALLSLIPAVTLVDAQTLAVGTLGGFESPAISSYVYSPPTNVLQPWTWSSQGGIARRNSPFQPNGTSYNAIPPSPENFAFMQTGSLSTGTFNYSNMSTTVTGLVTGQQYRLTFYLATRYDNGNGWQTQSQEFVWLGSVQLWQSEANISDAAGWRQINVTFQAAAASSVLLFETFSTSLNDRSVLVDSVLIQPITYTGVGRLDIQGTAISTPNSFEFPNLNASFYGSGLTMQSFMYNPVVSDTQPWSFTNLLGGFALSGTGTWDPPPPVKPPSGAAFAFLQTSPDSDPTISNSASMWTTLVNLVPNTAYSVSFFWAIRALTNKETEQGWQTQSQLSITVDGVRVYLSAQNLTDIGGWNQALTSGFTATSTSAVLSFNVVSLSTHDHTVLIDAVSVDPAPPTSGTLAVNTLSNFESPYPISYIYNPAVTVLQPWTWTSADGGIAANGSPFDPYGGTDAPSAAQYAFLQVGSSNSVSNMSTSLVGLISGSTYTLSFYMATRYDNGNGNQTYDTEYVYVGNTLVYQSEANISDAFGWRFVNATFIAPSANPKLVFCTVASMSLDKSLLIDSVMVSPVGYTSPTGQFISWSNMSSPAASFESPSLDGTTYGPGLSLQNYMYNPPLSANQPWTFTPQASGGFAKLGSAWDGPSPSTPPAGIAYAFLQTSPNAATNRRSTNMSTTLSGLATGASYAVSFYWAARAGQNKEPEQGYQTQDQLTVFVNGYPLYVSETNMTDLGGWKQVTTSPFLTQSSTSASLVFAVQSTTDHDHALLIDAVALITPVGQLAVAQRGGFESPVVGGGSWQHNPPVTAVQPWTWTAAAGGVAVVKSPWDPPVDPVTGVPDPPSNGQYAFLQTGVLLDVNMSCMVTGLTVSVQHTLTFYIAARLATGNATFDQETVYLNSQQLWQSVPNYADAGGWQLITVTFTPTASSAMLVFRTQAARSDDRAILIDSVLIAPSSVPVPTLTTFLPSSNSNSFEYPQLSGYGPGVSLQKYMYNPELSANQPWTWTTGLGGIAVTSSPFDPPPPSQPPHASQYSFLQTSPNAHVGQRTSSMSTTLSGLTTTLSYNISFYFGIRAGSNMEPEAGNQTQSQLVVMFANAPIYTSVQNLTDAGGWIPITTSSFSPSAASGQLSFVITSITDHDHTLLFDAVSINPSNGIIPSSTAAPSSSTAIPSSSTAVASSSSVQSSSVVTSSPVTSSSAVVSSSSAVSSSSSTSSTSSSSTPGVPTNPDSSSSSSLSGGAIAGAVIGSVVGAVILCGFCFFCVLGKRAPKDAKWTTQNDEAVEDDHHSSHASAEEHTTDIEMA